MNVSSFRRARTGLLNTRAAKTHSRPNSNCARMALEAKFRLCPVVFAAEDLAETNDLFLTSSGSEHDEQLGSVLMHSGRDHVL